MKLYDFYTRFIVENITCSVSRFGAQQEIFTGS